MKFIQNKEIFAVDLDNEVCIFNPENGEYINLNKTGSDIWNFLVEKKSLDTILDFLCDRYKGEKEKIKKNLLDFLDEGVKNGLISRLN